VWCTRIPKEEITRLSANLDPLAAMSFEPLHSGRRETVPLWCPGGNALLTTHGIVIFLTQEVSAFTDDEATVVRPIGQEIDESAGSW